MNTKKIILSSLAIGGLVLAAGTTFAAYKSGSNFTGFQSKMGHFRNFGSGTQMKWHSFGSGNQMGMMYGKYRGGEMGLYGVSKFIDYNSLTADQKTQLKSIIDGYLPTAQQFMNNIRTSTGDQQSQYKTQFSQSLQNELQKVRPFVSSGNLSGFDQFVSQVPTMISSMGNKGSFGGKHIFSHLGGQVNRFIDYSKLTGDQLSGFQSSMKSYENQLKTIKNNMRTATGDQLSGYQAQFKQVWTQQMQAIRPYVKQDQLATFDQFVQNGPKFFDKDNRKNNGLKGKGHRGGR